ncbi:DUF6531 domain-containing protein [Amycolatopsis acidiphila]|uniref:Type IV secretion protein Rhs n=1 Tax=Amycolatopsis acidiphila TaxID=715473 RepID=A0A558A9F2_9PSEU|nr:RHS repeat-associated core domain-containing protein [Amycolatopsis acidiphila]TVT20885.1 type IV secretion protein Rhs [Amycolatopsis acidiphila]UIJ63020.1 DUF6531 domain-containing protein [Amycolatopsis acidiphila]GHG65687.1 type IV secretion protein Rhs [Amycolatopsis acidiphila]
MTNPLVAQAKDSTTGISGISILEDGQALKQGIESGDWASTVMGVAGTAMDALAFVADPFGSILAAGVGWLMEHVGPLKEALDKLAGSPDQITAHSETWKNIASELGQVATDLGNQVEADVQSWTGPGADSYRRQADDMVKILQGAGQACEGASSGVKTAGEVVAAVRQLVRDTIAQVVGHMISWALQVLFTLGIGLTWVVPQVVNLVAKTAKDIASLVKNLTKALGDLGKLLGKAGDLFKDAAKGMKGLKPGPKAAPGKVDTLPSGAKNVDPVGDKTIPSGASGKGGGDAGKIDPPPKLNDGDTAPSGAKDTGGGDASPPPKTGDGAGAPKSDDVPPPKLDDSGGTPKGSPDSTKPSSSKPDNPRDTAVGPDQRKCLTDPVDIATGEVILQQTDLRLPDLLLERVHVSSYRAGRWFGPSWASTVDQRLELDGAEVGYVGPDGVILVYPLPAPGEPVLPVEGARWPLARHADGTFTIDQPLQGRTLHFSATGSLRAVEGADGERAELFHDEAGAPVLLTHSSGVRVGFRTDGGRLTQLRVLGGGVPDVVVLDYRYDDLGRLTGVVNSSGIPLRFDYDPHGRLTGWQDRNGVWYRYVYDPAGRCIRTVGAEGFLDGVFDYDRERLVTRFTDSLGHVSEFQLNAAGQTVRETDALGGVTVFEWDRYDRLLSRTDPLGRVTRYLHDADGTPLQIVRPDGSVLSLEHADGVLASVTVHGVTRVWRRFYEPGAAPDPIDEPVGVATAADLEPAPRDPAAVPDPADRDQFGRPRSAPEAGGGRVLLGWTVDGLPASRTRSRSAREIWRYDGEGNEVEHVDELGRVTRREYGPFDLVTAVVDPAGARTRYGYDTELRLVSVTDPVGRRWTFRYDPVGRLVGQTDFDGRTWAYGYDAAGQLVRSTGPDGGVTENRYDVLGNLVEVRTQHGSTSYAYDPVGEVVRVSSAESVVEFDRDEYGRVVREAIDGRAVTFAYDEQRRTIRRRTPSGAESEWSFDERERPVSLVTAGHTVRYRLDADGRAVARDVDGVSVLEQSFGPRGLLAAQRLSAAAAPLRGRGFEYQADGRLAGVRDDQAGHLRLVRDVTGRVVTASTPAGQEELRYDPAGNLTAWSGGTGPAVEYDALGRRTRRRESYPDGVRVWEYEWTGDLLTGLRTPDGWRWRYRYDPLGRRIAKECLLPDGSVAESVRFVWDGTVLVEQEHLGRDGVRRSTTWERRPGGHEPVTQLERGPGAERFHSVVTDALGTPTDLVDETGGLAWSGRRTVWGAALPSPGARATTPLRFPGQYADEESGLHYNVFRYYDPATARYLSQDPLGMAAGPNPTAYVADPFAEFDALGLMGCSDKTTPSSGKGAPSGNPPAKHNAGNSGGSANTPGTSGKGKRKRDDDGDDTKPKKSKKDPRAPWDRPEKFERPTDNNLKAQKKDPANPGFGGGQDVHARHVVSFQTMRDNLKSWVDKNYPPGHPDRDAMIQKYDGELVKMNSKIENLPLGPGKPNTAIGSTVNNFPNIQSRIDGTYTPGKGEGPAFQHTPSEAFDQSSGYIKDIKGEFADPIMKAADNITDPAERKEFLDDVRFSADFDWPGGNSDEFKTWQNVHGEIEDLGANPGRYGPAEVDEIIGRFNNLESPSGTHDSKADFSSRPR